MLDGAVVFLATGLGLGFAASLGSRAARKLRIFKSSPRLTGAGLLGSLLGLALAWLGFPLAGKTGLFSLLALTGLSIVLTGRAETVLGAHDDSRIILDEVCGMLWALAFLPAGPHSLWILAAGLVLFRLFDVLKLPIPQAQDLKGGLGVVMDDVLAGLLANALLQVLVRVPWRP